MNKLKHIIAVLIVFLIILSSINICNAAYYANLQPINGVDDSEYNKNVANTTNDDFYTNGTYEYRIKAPKYNMTFDNGPTVSTERVHTVTSDEGSSAGTNLNRLIGRMIMILRVVGVCVASSLLLLSISRQIYYSNKCQKLEQDSLEDHTEELERARKTLKGIKQRRILAIIGAVLLFAASGVLGIIRSFKPIIYIYPEEDNMPVTISLSKPENLTCSYPEYKDDGWQVIANKDGTLKEIGKEREYYSLYWEGLIHSKGFKDGFVVKGEDTREFLEEKLEVLGLTDKEAEEFIVYWLPKMEKNNYNLIRFLTYEELNEEMALTINPEPDTLIRIQMQYKPLLFKTSIPEQKLEKVVREGYTVVEWGGSIAK